MPDIRPGSYNRSSSFLDQGYTNVPPQTPIDTGVPVQESTPVQPNDLLDSIFKNLDRSVRDTNPFISSLQYTTPVRTPLQETLRYKDPYLGYDPFNPNLEYMYGDRQSGLEKWKNNLLKFGANTLGALVETVAAIPETISAVSQGDLSKAFDNDLHNSVSEWLNNMEDTLPNYQTTFEKNSPILKYIPGFASLGTLGDSWGGVLKNLGFIAGTIGGSIIQDAVIASATEGVGELPLIAPQIMRAFGRLGKAASTTRTTEEVAASLLRPAEQALGDIYNAGKTTTLTESFTRGDDLINAINKASTARNIVNKFRYGTAFTTSVLAQGTIFANETYNTVKRDLTQRFKEKAGRDPNREDMADIEKYAVGAGNADLYANLALLTLTEGNVLGSLFKPTALARKAVTREALRTIPIERVGMDAFSRIQSASKFDIISNAVPVDALKSIGFGTAFVGGTSLISRTAEDFYKRKFDDPATNTTNNFTLSLGTGLRDTFNTSEGLEGLFMGALIGGVIHGGKKLAEKIKGIDNSRQSLVEGSLSWLNSERLSGLFEHTYDEAVASESIKRDMDDAIRKGDIFEFKNLKFQQLYNFVDSGVKAHRFDLRVEQLNSLKEMSQKDFEAMFKLPFNDQNRRTVNDFVDSIVNKAFEIKENVDKVNELFQNPYDIKSKDPDELLKYRVFEDYKSQLSLDLSQIKDNRRRLEQISNEITLAIPLLDKEKIIKLTSEQGVQETIEDLNKRIGEIKTSLEIAQDKTSPEYKNYVKERNFLQDKVKQLSSHLENYDGATYPKLAEDLMNYYINHGIEFKNQVSPIDVVPTLEKAKDAFKLINATDRALYHYQQLVSKEGFDGFIAEATEERIKQQEKFLASAMAEKLTGTPVAKPTEPAKTDEADIDAKGNIKPKEPVVEAKKTTIEEKRKEVRSAIAKAGQGEGGAFTTTLVDGSEHQMVRLSLVGDDIFNEKGDIVDIGLIDKIENPDGTIIYDAKAPIKPVETDYAAELSLPGIAEEVVLPFERQDNKKVEGEQIEEEKRIGRRSDLFENFAPFINFNRLYSENFPDVAYYDNLKDEVFYHSPENVNNRLEIKVVASTKGAKAGEWKPFSGFDNIYHQGYKTDIQLVADGKVIGLIRPLDSLAFKREGEFLPLNEVTPEEYEKVTRNSLGTYDDFISQLNEYKEVIDKIQADFAEGKTAYTNEEFKKFFDTFITYGKADYSDLASTSTKIKDLKYKTEGDAVLSLPMVYDKTGEVYERSTQPTIINKAELSPEDLRKLWIFVGDNIERLKKLNSRYIYVFKLPNGEYAEQSPVVARPIEQSPEVLEALFKVIQSVTPGSISEEKRANIRLKDNLYIADSRNGKGKKSNISLEFNKGTLYLKVNNESKKFRKAYQIDTKDLRNFDDLVAAINRKLDEKSNDPKLSKLNLRLEAKDFKASILKDEKATLKNLEDKLAVSTFPFPFKGYRMFVLPRKGEEIKPKEVEQTKEVATQVAKEEPTAPPVQEQGQKAPEIQPEKSIKEGTTFKEVANNKIVHGTDSVEKLSGILDKGLKKGSFVGAQAEGYEMAVLYPKEGANLKAVGHNPGDANTESKITTKPSAILFDKGAYTSEKIRPEKEIRELEIKRLNDLEKEKGRKLTDDEIVNDPEIVKLEKELREFEKNGGKTFDRDKLEQQVIDLGKKHNIPVYDMYYDEGTDGYTIGKRIDIKEEAQPEKSLIEQAKESAGDIKELYRQAFLDSPEQSLKEIAEQLHDPKSEVTTRKTFGDKVSNIALQLHPKEEIKATKPLPKKEKWQTPIPVDSVGYWGHLSEIQNAFINKKYDEPLRKGEITEQELKDIVTSTISKDNAGLPQSLVEDVVFRVGNQELIDNVEYWKEPLGVEDKGYVSYLKTIKEVLRNGQFSQAIKTGVLTPEEARLILDSTKQTSVLADKAIKEKQKEIGEQEKEVEVAEVKSENEPPSEVVEKPVKIDKFEKEEPVLYKDKQYTVKSIETTSSGNVLYTINDGTKYGDKLVYPEQLQKLVEEQITYQEVLDDVKAANYKELEGDKGELAEQDHKVLTYVGLKTLLERLYNKFSIPYKIVETSENWKGRFKDGTVLINVNKYDNTTPFHEYLHPFIAVLEKVNEPLYRNLAGELSSKLGKEIITEVQKDPVYKGRSKDDIGKEALVRYISKAAAQNITSEGRRVKNKYYEAAKGLLDRFRKWLVSVLEGIRWDGNKNKPVKDTTLAGKADLALIPEEATLEDIADLVSLHDMKFDMQAQSDLFKALDEFQAGVNKESDEFWILDRARQRVKVLEDTAKRRLPSDELVANVISIRSILKDPETVESLDRYLRLGVRGLGFANEEFSRITGKLKSPDEPLTQADVIDISRSMGVVKNLISFYKEDVDHLMKWAAKRLEPEVYTDFLETLNRTDNTINRIKSRTVDIITEWLYPSIEEAHRLNTKYPEYKLTKAQFKKKIYNAESDIDTLSFLFGTVATSKDPLNAITHSVIKNLYEDSHFAASEVGETIKISYDKFLRDTKLSNERASTIDHYKKNYLRKAEVQEKIGEDENGDPIYEYKQYWAFHEKYFHDLFQKKRTDFMEAMKFDPENQAHIDALIEWEKQNTKEIEEDGFKQRVPTDEFLNPEFEKLYGKDQFFTFMYDYYKIANDKLSEDERLKYGLVPQVSKGGNLFADYSWNKGLGNIKTLGGKVLNFILPEDQSKVEVRERVKKLEKERNEKIEKLDKNNPEYQKNLDEINAEYEDKISKVAVSDDVVKNLDGTYFRNVKTKYVRHLEEADLDLALPETMLKFFDSTNLTTNLREIEPNVALLKSYIEGNSEFIKKTRAITKVTSDNAVIMDRVQNFPSDKEDVNKRLNKQLTHFLDNTVYEHSEDKETANLFGIRTIDLNRLGGNWAFLNSTVVLAGNVTAGISNVIIGEVNSFGEAMGGKYFGKGNWLKASGLYTRNIPNFFTDSVNLKKSLLTQLGIKYDAIQGEFRDKYGKRIVGNIAQRYATADTLFVLLHMGEHEIQTKAMTALMLGTEVKTRDGQITNLYDAHELNKEGHLRLKENVIWTKDDDRAFTSRLHGLNKYLNGVYNKFDAVYAQRKWYGKASLVFRKYLYPALKFRYGKPYYDYEIRDRQSGYYMTFFKKLASDIQNYKFDAATRFFTRKGWNEDERYAYNKTVYELSLFTSAILLGIVMARAEDENAKKDEQWGQQYLSLLMVRLRSDLGQYNVAGIPDLFRIAKNPISVMGTADKLGTFFGQLVSDPFGEYKRKTGIFDKGESILKAKFLKLLPFYNQYIKLRTPEEQKKFYNFLNKN